MCDLRDAGATASAIRRVQPDVVIHAQALSDVDQAHRDPDLARALNVQTTANLVRALAGTRALLIAISSDYVFDGSKGAPYDERDEPNPISVYGASKLDSERLALGYARSVIVRTSTLFGPGRANFCSALVARLTDGQPVEAFGDQVTSPTYTEDVASAIAELGRVLTASVGGTSARLLHIANAGSCSRAVFARRVAELVGASQELIRVIPMAQQGRPAARPRYSALTTAYLHAAIGRMLRPWEEALHAYLQQQPSIGQGQDALR